MNTKCKKTIYTVFNVNTSIFHVLLAERYEFIINQRACSINRLNYAYANFIDENNALVNNNH